MAHRLLGLADKFADGKIAFLLEGGYDLAGLRGSVAAVLAAMQSGAAPAVDAAQVACQSDRPADSPHSTSFMSVIDNLKVLLIHRQVSIYRDVSNPLKIG